jgi:hypothetical protein
MKSELIPYYASRGVLSVLIGVLILLGGSPWWLALLIGILVFAGFLWYAHSGFYLVDPSQPLTPLRRDARASAIRDRAVVISVVVGAAVYLALSLAGLALPLTLPSMKLAVAAAVAGYFVISTWLFVSDSRA